MRLIRLLSLVACGWMAQAGTTVIHVDTEDGGNVVIGGVVVNARGALFWNGSQWVSSDTAAHMYFTDLRTGARLMTYTTLTVEGNAPGLVGGTPRYTVVRSLFDYEKAVTGGVYRFQAVQYRVTATAPSAELADLVLRSRGTTAGTGGAFFDVYLLNPDGGGVTAVRGDPGWFNYSGMNLDAALGQRSATVSKAGDFPSTGANYWLDINGGSDMSGTTLQLKTGALTPADAGLGWGGSYTVEASVKFMNGTGLQEIRFLPWAQGTFVAAPSSVPLPPTAWLALTGLAATGVAEWRRRRRR